LSVAAPVRRRIGRFALLRELGRGAQATVWLAHDERLDREVALKLLNPDSDAQALSEWLNEARAVSRLAHPNIVPVFEADENDGQPYLVFEYVPGPTLAQARRRQGPMPPREAVALLLGVLDALAAAHDQGLVHRDLKPSNILLGTDSRARVMDFGIAARVAQGDGRIVGTPGYISPEAARGEPPVPAMDVFAAGVLLGELLCGQPLLRETDPWRAVHRVQHEDLLLPEQTAVDATLRGIVQRALSRDIGARHDSARALHAALAAWLQPAAAPEAANGHATLDFLLRRMRHKTDFPALSAAVVRIQRVAASEKESLKSLSDAILQDVALTSKLLRMVNSAHFSAVGGGSIATVSRAVALVGFAGIRNLALSLVLLEHMPDKAHAGLIKAEFLRALMAGTLAGELATRDREGEEAFLAALMQNLGRLLTEYYFPEEAQQIRQQLAGTPATAAQREAAARRVLGIGHDELGAGVAKAWGLPETLQHALRTPPGEPPARLPERAPDRAVERLRWLGRGANALADALLAHEGEAQVQALMQAANAHASVLGLTPRELVAAAHSARTQLTEYAQALGLPLAPDAAARRRPELPAGGAAAAPAAPKAAPPAVPAAPDPAAWDRTVADHGAQAVLVQALGTLRKGTPVRAAELMALVLQAMQQAFGFRALVFCLREPGSHWLAGRLGHGEGAKERAAAFRVLPDAAASGDLFALLCAKGADLLVADSRSVVHRLPAWYRQGAPAPTFLLMPLMHKGRAIGLLYADKAQAGEIVLPETEATLLRTLRDEAALALVKGGS
jgi:serine/threonine protein kinase